MDNLEEHHPQQIEFARLNLTNTVMSKRKLRQLVEEGAVEGWDDPRMPTLSGYRRRGVRPEAIRKFADRIGVAKANSTIDIQMLQHVIREDLDAIVPRAMAVMRPIKVVIENYPEDKVEEFEIDYYRHDKEKEEKRKVYLTREVYIEEKDFEEDPPPKYFRLTPGREVRLMGACLITATEVIKDNDGNIQEVGCTYDPESLGGQAPDGRKVKGTIHWVSASKAVDAEVRIFDHLIIDDDSYSEDEGKDFLSKINPKSKEVLQAKVESALAGASPGDRFQFMRDGYYFIDPKDSSEDHLVFNQIVGLRDTWGKQQKKK